MSSRVIIGDETFKIDKRPADALEGIPGSLAYIAKTIERHHHNVERWFEAATTPNGEIHVADRIGEGLGAFQADAGNDDWGTWLQILGSNDTPANGDKAFFDFHRIFISAIQRALSIHFIQIGFANSGAEALSNGNYTEFVYKPAAVNAFAIPIEILATKNLAGTKAWMRINIPGQPSGTVDFYPGLHEYEGN